MVYKMLIGSMDINSSSTTSNAINNTSSDDELDSTPTNASSLEPDNFDALFNVTARLTISYYLGAMQGLQSTSASQSSSMMVSMMTQTLSSRILRLVENFNNAMAGDRAIAQDMFYALTWAEGPHRQTASPLQMFSLGVIHAISFSPEVLMREKKWTRVVHPSGASDMTPSSSSETLFADYMQYSDMRTELDGIHLQMIRAIPDTTPPS